MKSKNYDVEFKLRAVELLRESGRTKTAIAKELGVSDSTLCKWVIQYESGQLRAKEGNLGKRIQSSSEREIARLTAELKRKNMELEILKKATAFFAKNQY